MNTIQSVKQDIANEVFLQAGLLIDGQRIGDEFVGINIVKRKRNFSRSYYSPRGPLKIVVTIGDFSADGARTYKERQNGTFNIKKIAESLITIRNNKLIQRRRERRTADVRSNAVQQRNLTLSLLGGDRSEYSSTVEVNRHNYLESKITVIATPENAEKLAKVLAYAEELGIAV